MNKAQLDGMLAKFREDANTIITASIMTILFVGSVVTFMFTVFHTFPNIGGLAGLYILFNFCLLSGFIYRHSRYTWDIDELGNEVHNLYDYIKLRGD